MEFYLLLVTLCCSIKVTYSAEECPHPCQQNNSCLTKIGNTCYHVFSYNMTWSESKKFCKSQHMTMVQLPTKVTIERLVSDAGPFAESLSGPLWLGGRYKNLKNWTFVNGVTWNATSTNFSTLEHGHRKKRCGVFAIKDNGRLDVDSDRCLEQYHPFICRFDDLNHTKSTYVSTDSVNWYEARSRCSFLGGDLFYLTEDESLEWIEEKLKPFQSQTFFIGLTHKLWQWEDENGIKYYNWKQKEPQNLNNKCLVMSRPGGQWENADCNSKAQVFCQAAAMPPGVDESTRKPYTPRDPIALQDDSSHNNHVSTTTMLFVLGGMLVLLAITVVCLVACFTKIHRKEAEVIYDKIRDVDVATSNSAIDEEQPHDVNNIENMNGEIGDDLEIFDNPFYDTRSFTAPGNVSDHMICQVGPASIQAIEMPFLGNVCSIVPSESPAMSQQDFVKLFDAKQHGSAKSDPLTNFGRNFYHFEKLVGKQQQERNHIYVRETVIVHVVERRPNSDGISISKRINLFPGRNSL